MTINPTPSQRKAIFHKGSDLLISAGAGSGKTATLIARIVERLENGADISRILLVTFTKAASNELKGRISKALSELLEKNPSNEHLSSQLVKIAGADISTIDSFCMKIVRPSFDKLGIDSDFRIGETGEIEILRSESMDEVIDRFYERDDDEDFLTVCDCYEKIGDESSLGEELLELHKRLVSTPDSIKTLLKSNTWQGDFLDSKYGVVLKDYLKSMLLHYKSVYERALSEIRTCEKCMAGYGAAFEKDYTDINELLLRIDMGYEALRNYFNNSLEILSLKAVRGSELDLEELKGIRGQYKNDITGMRDTYFKSSADAILSASMQNDRICRAIYNILEEFEAEFSRKKKQHGICDFNDIERFALKLLYAENGELTPLALDIRDKYDEIYIDEYQDTSSVQDAIFKAISKNNRFMVGDIKQSIYRFRSAEPEIFASYRNEFSPIDSEGEGGKSIFMSENFRCDSTIIDFSNLLSDRMFGVSQSIPYEASDRLIFSKTDLPPDYVEKPCEICVIEKESVKDGDDEDTLYKEAEYVACEIKRILSEEYLPSGERVKPSNIAILVRNAHRNAQKFVDALKAYGVGAEYTDDESFFEKSEVLLALSILNVIDNPTRDVYLAGAMRSDIFGFSLEELIEIKKNAGDTSLYSALRYYSGDATLKDKIDNFLETLRKYRESSRKLSSYEIIADIYSSTPILSMCNQAERKSLLKLYDLARKYEGKSYKGLYSFLRYVEKISKSDTLSPERVSKSHELVTVATIHGSKGLDYEYCFLCCANSPFAKKEEKKPLLYHRSLGIAGFVGREGGVAKFNTLIRKIVALAIRQSNVEEEMRLLYVAMTRAKHKLYVTGTERSIEKANTEYKRMERYFSPYLLKTSDCYFDFIMPAALEPKAFFKKREIIGSVEKTEKTDTSVGVSYSDELKNEYVARLRERFSFKYHNEAESKLPSKLSISKLYPSILDGTENDEIDIDKSFEYVPSFIENGEKQYTSADRGIATHVFMQFCDFKSLKENGVEYELKALVDKQFISEETMKLVSLSDIEAFRQSELLSELLSAKRVMREFRFNVMLPVGNLSKDPDLQNKEVLVQGVTDCIYENDRGELVLVDYKTDRVTLKNYENELRERHSTQLEYYKRACEMIFERPLKKAIIYSVPLAKTVEI